MKKYSILMAGIFSALMFSVAYAGTVTQSKVYATNDQVTATNLNGNLQAIITTLNGGIDNENIKTSSGYRLFEVLGTVPSAGTQGRVIFNTSSNTLNFDTGTTFIMPVTVSGTPSNKDVVYYNGTGWDRYPNATDQFGAKDSITRGFELTYTSSSAIVVNPGTLYHNITRVDKTANTTLTLSTDADWYDGSAHSYSGGAGWCYVGVDGSGNVKLLAANAPDYADTLGNAAGTKLYYKQGSTYWRVLGAFRVSTSDEVASVWYQSSDYIALDVPVSITTSLSSSAWSGAVSCGAAMPAISKRGVFGATVSHSGTGAVLIRPNGSTFATGAQDGLYYSGSVSGTHVIGGRLTSNTDASQQIQHYETGSAVAIDLIGYYLTIR